MAHRIRKSRPRCQYVYYCALKADPEGSAILTDAEIERCRCVLPSGHKVDGWKHEHITINPGLRFDYHCHELLQDVRKEWDYHHSAEFLASMKRQGYEVDAPTEDVATFLLANHREATT